MNFWKSAKGKGGHFQSKNVYCRFWELQTGLFDHEIDIKNNKTISDGGITVDFSIIKVHTSN